MFAELLQRGGLSLDRLQTLCLVAEAGAVTRAAKGDPSRQSLFSRQIKELEEFFGVELVRRKGRGLALTPAGERLHLLAREQLLALSDFKQEAAGESVVLTVAAGDSLIQWLLLPRLRAIREKLPKVAFRMLNLPTAEIATRLREGTVDLGLVRTGSTGSGARPLKTWALGAMTFSLFVPAAMLSATEIKRISAAALARLPLATLEGSGQFRQEVQRLAERHNVTVKPQLELTSFPLVARAVATGAYAGILPGIAATELASFGVIESQPDFLRSLSREIVLAWNPRLARIRAALDKAIPVFSAMPVCGSDLC